MSRNVTNFVLDTTHTIASSLKRKNEGGSTIHNTRRNKFKKKSSLIIFAKLLGIWYFLILAGSYLTTDTGAYFSDTGVINNSFQSGTWVVPDNDVWDRSSLDIDPGTAWADGYTVYATIKNAGEDMTFSTWRFYVYKFVNNNPLGSPIATGIVSNIKKGEFGEMSATVTEPGVYKFTVRRPLGHPGKNNKDSNGYSFLGWSQPIVVD